MLPAILVTIATFLLEFYTASPVYNMQPAFITANIGTGRNIRNLPCISRKNNQSGVCMFVIDCVKANGTHLGTCIDRFYFGSCCHIEPIHDIIENSIDTDIIPAREPPLRLSSTIKPITTTTAKPTVPSVKTTTITITTEKLTTTTIKPETTVAYKLTTFQSVDGLTTETTTTTTTTSKPITTPSTQKPKPTSKPTSKPTTKPTSKPTTKPTSKPIISKPTTKPTSKPITSKPTTKPVTKPKPTTPTRGTTAKPTKSPVVTRKPSTTKAPITSTTTTTQTTVKTTTTRPTTTTTKSTTTTTKKPTSTTSTTTLGTTISTPNTTENNEIEKPSITSTTIKPQIITWSVIESERNTTMSSTSSTNSTSEEWSPITTPDGWVLLPSVPPNTTTQPIETTTTTTLRPTITTESTSRPSITFIPIGSSTTLPSTSTSSSTSNITTATPPIVSPDNSTSSITTITSPIPTTTTEIAETTIEDRPVNMSDFTDVCGRRMYPEARIVGGEKSTFGKWPWQISLRQWRTSTYLHKCGAALLNENWAITAAHCVDNVPPSDLLLRLGEHDLSTESEPYLHQERRVQIVASHPQFDPRTFEYDLALLRFYEPVTFQPNILPVCVPQTDENFVGRTAHVTGWGRLYEDGPLPSVLQEVSVPVINNTVCESMYRSAGYIEHIPHIFICAGWRRGGYDSCEGDSGGPMVIQREDKRFLLAGVISWGIGCAEPNQPGVYTRISEFRDWINQILQF